MCSFKEMTCLQFYQWGMKNPSAMGVCLPFFFDEFRDGLSSVVIVVTPLTAIMKDQVIDTFLGISLFSCTLSDNQPHLPTLSQYCPQLHTLSLVWHSHTLHIEEEGSGSTSTNKLCLVAVIPATNHKP